MIERKAPEDFREDIKNRKSIFLAGSIDMGKAVDWQTKITNQLKDLDVCVLNPRRDDWDSTWEQSINNPQFKEQVTWELYGLNKCDVIALYFADNSQSPISLLELGLHAGDGKVIIYCSDNFWRKGNVDIVANVFDIPVFDDEKKWFEAVKQKCSQ